VHEPTRWRSRCVERRERLLQPALELAGALLASTNSADGGNHEIAADAFAFVEAHADTLVRAAARPHARTRARPPALAGARHRACSTSSRGTSRRRRRRRRASGVRRLLLALPGRFADTAQWQQRAALALMGGADVAPRDYAAAPRRWRAPRRAAAA
jgi:hypothetical protein